MSYVFLVLSLFISTFVYALDCSTIWSLGFPDMRPPHTPVECQEFSPAMSPRVPEQAYYIVESLTRSEAVKEQMEMIAEAVSYSAGKYAIFGRVPRITVVRQDIAHPNGGGPSAMAFTYVQFFNIDRETCPIFVYPMSEVLNKEELQQAIAHEVFHCVQKVNFKDEVSFAAGNPDESYWFEGLAQYFSNWVYPRNDFEYTSRFPAPDQAFPFFQQSSGYSSENFWQSYANFLGDTAVYNMMSRMPTGAGTAVPTTVVNLPRFSEALHEYAKQITRKKVRDSSGAMSPYDMTFEGRVLNDIDHQEMDLPHYDMTVGAFEIVIPKAGKWTLQFNRPANTKVSFKKFEEENFHAVDAPFEITSECDQERRIQVVITTASDAEAMNATRLVVDKRANPECDCRGARPDAPPQKDRCLIGTWELDHGSVPQFWHRTSRMPNTEFMGSSGSFTVNFKEDNTGDWSAIEWLLHSRSHMGRGMVMEMRHTTNGISQFRYSANNGVACSNQISSGMSVQQVVTMDGRTVSTTTGLPLDMSNGFFTYSCNESTFTLRVFEVGGNSQVMDYIFHRL